jgi:hypothetical protein
MGPKSNDSLRRVLHELNKSSKIVGGNVRQDLATWATFAGRFGGAAADIQVDDT